MTQIDQELERRWALGEPGFDGYLEAGADIVEAFAAAGLLDASEAQSWRERFARAIRGPLRWPPPRPDARERALQLLQGLVDAPDEERPSEILHHFAAMNLITTRDVAELGSQYWPGDDVEADAVQEPGSVAVEQPEPGSRLDVVWVRRSSARLTLRWRLRDMQLDYGNPDVEPPDHLGRFELVTADGTSFSPAGGGLSAGYDAAEGTLEFIVALDPGQATLRFAGEERAVTVP
jgi:hypothetical protein